MAKKGFNIVYAAQVKQHLAVIEKRHHSLIRQTIEERLTHEPEVETRNRKPLREPGVLGARWELRFGPDNRFRAFYRVDAEECTVLVLAIGVKERNRLFVGREEVSTS